MKHITISDRTDDGGHCFTRFYISEDGNIGDHWIKHTLDRDMKHIKIEGNRAKGPHATHYYADGTECSHRDHLGIWTAISNEPLVRYNFELVLYQIEDTEYTPEQAKDAFRACSILNTPMILYWLMTGKKFSNNPIHRQIYKIIKGHINRKF